MKTVELYAKGQNSKSTIVIVLIAQLTIQLKRASHSDNFGVLDFAVATKIKKFTDSLCGRLQINPDDVREVSTEKKWKKKKDTAQLSQEKLIKN